MKVMKEGKNENARAHAPVTVLISCLWMRCNPPHPPPPHPASFIPRIYITHGDTRARAHT